MGNCRHAKTCAANVVQGETIHSMYYLSQELRFHMPTRLRGCRGQYERSIELSHLNTNVSMTCALSVIARMCCLCLSDGPVQWWSRSTSLLSLMLFGTLDDDELYKARPWSPRHIPRSPRKCSGFSRCSSQHYAQRPHMQRRRAWTEYTRLCSVRSLSIKTRSLSV